MTQSASVDRRSVATRAVVPVSRPVRIKLVGSGVETLSLVSLLLSLALLLLSFELLAAGAGGTLARLRCLEVRLLLSGLHEPAVLGGLNSLLLGLTLLALLRGLQRHEGDQREDDEDGDHDDEGLHESAIPHPSVIDTQAAPVSAAVAGGPSPTTPQQRQPDVMDDDASLTRPLVPVMCRAS